MGAAAHRMNLLPFLPLIALLFPAIFFFSLFLLPAQDVVVPLMVGMMFGSAFQLSRVHEVSNEKGGEGTVVAARTSSSRLSPQALTDSPTFFLLFFLPSSTSFARRW